MVPSPLSGDARNQLSGTQTLPQLIRVSGLLGANTQALTDCHCESPGSHSAGELPLRRHQQSQLLQAGLCSPMLTRALSASRARCFSLNNLPQLSLQLFPTVAVSLCLPVRNLPSPTVRCAFITSVSPYIQWVYLKFSFPPLSSQIVATNTVSASPTQGSVTLQDLFFLLLLLDRFILHPAGAQPPVFTLPASTPSAPSQADRNRAFRPTCHSFSHLTWLRRRLLL